MFSERLDEIDRIMTLPQIVDQINRLVESKTASATDLHRVIKADPALSARILRLVNSAYYGLPGRVGSLEKALILLGVTAVKNLAIGAGVEQLFHRLNLPGPLSGRDMWTHSLSVAAGARELGRRAGMDYLEEIFMAGIIHDLGVLAAAQVEPADFAAVVHACMGSKNRWAIAELEILGIDHAAAGAHLAARWHFPSYLVAMVRDHHTWPEKPEASDLTGVVFLADTIACGLGEGFTLSAQSQNIEPEMLDRLGLTQEDVTEVWRNLPAHTRELNNLLHM